MPGAVIGSLRAELSASIAQFQADMGKAAEAVEKFAKRAKTVSRDIGRVGQELSLELTAPLVAFAVESVKAANEITDAAGQVTAALQSMGNRSGKSLEDLQKSAEDLRDTSLFSDANILRNVTANMLTFGNVSGAVFDRAQQAALNLATRLKTDLQSATITVGKALNDPIKGLTALSRVGVTFTQNQKDQIKALVRSGQGYKAQGLILQELEREFGGAAKAALDASPTGQLIHSWDKLKEVIGAIVVQYLPPLINFLTTVANKFEALSPSMQKAIVAGLGIVALVGPLLVFTSTILKAGVTIAEVFGSGGLLAEGFTALLDLGAAVGALAGAAFGPIIIAVGALIADLIVFRNVVMAGVDQVVAAFQGGLGKDIPKLLAALGNLFATIMAGPIGDFFKVVGYWLAQFLTAFATGFGLIVVQILDGFVVALTAVVKVITDLVKLVGDLLNGDWKAAWADAGAAVSDFVGGMADTFTALFPAISAWAKGVHDTLADWLGKKTQDIVDGFVQRFPAVAGILQWAAGEAETWAKQIWASMKTWINDNLGPVITWTMDRLAELGKFFGKQVGEANAVIAGAKTAPPKPAATPKPAPKLPPFIPPTFNQGTAGPDKIKAATKKYADAIRALNDEVAKGLDEKALPKSVAAAEALRRKIAEITDDAQKSGVAIGNYAGQINALKAQIDKLETAGLTKEAEKFGREVDKEGIAVQEFAKGGLAPLQERLQGVDDKYQTLKDSIQEQIDANAVLATKNDAAAASMVRLKAQLVALEAAHSAATDAAKAQYAAEVHIADLQSQASNLETSNAIRDLKQQSGQAGLQTPQQQRMQAIEDQLAKQRIAAATQLAELEAQYADAKRTGDLDTQARLGKEIDLQKQLLDLVDHTTATQVDAATKMQAAFDDLVSGLSDSLDSMLANWKFDLNGLLNVFRQFAANLAKPFLDSAASSIGSWIKDALGLGGGGSAGGTFGQAASSVGSFLQTTFAGLFAEGGTIKRGQWGIAGENGPEPVYAGATDMTVVPHGVAVQAGSGRPLTQVFNIGRMDQDTFRPTRRQFARIAQKAMGTA